MSGFLSLQKNWQKLSKKLFKKIKLNDRDRLWHLIPETRFHKHGRKLRNSKNLNVTQTVLETVFSHQTLVISIYIIKLKYLRYSIVI